MALTKSKKNRTACFSDPGPVDANEPRPARTATVSRHPWRLANDGSVRGSTENEASSRGSAAAWENAASPLVAAASAENRRVRGSSSLPQEAARSSAARGTSAYIGTNETTRGCESHRDAAELRGAGGVRRKLTRRRVGSAPDGHRQVAGDVGEPRREAPTAPRDVGSGRGGEARNDDGEEQNAPGDGGRRGPHDGASVQGHEASCRHESWQILRELVRLGGFVLFVAAEAIKCDADGPTYPDSFEFEGF